MGQLGTGTCTLTVVDLKFTPNGGFILANDMSQAEVRELAAVSHCEKLLDTVRDPNIDIHKKTASLAFDVPYDEVTKTQLQLTND